MSRKIVPASLRDLSYITANMRPEDAREVLPLEASEDPRMIAQRFLASSQSSWVIRETVPNYVIPIAAWGAVQSHPKNWNVWMIATPAFCGVALDVTRHIKDTVIPNLYHTGANRVEAVSIADNHLAHRWLTHLGAVIEHGDSESGGIIEHYGKNGESFLRFVWTRQSVERLYRLASRA